MIIVVGKVGCTMCVMVKNRFDQLNIPYDYVNIEDRVDKKDLIKRSAKSGNIGLPIVIIDGEIANIGDLNMCEYNIDKWVQNHGKR